MKKLLPYILLLCVANNINAQLYTEISNELKYWKLRGRLIGDEKNRDIYNGFMVVGSEQGMSIPAQIRYPLLDRNWWQYNIALNSNGTPSGECAYQKIDGKLVWPIDGYTSNNLNNTLNNPSQAIIDPRDGKDLRGTIFWGDNPIRTMGSYLAVLATEYKLLKNWNSNTDQTVKELYYALKAIDRLDLYGETLYGIPNLLNGFMRRGDVPRRFALDKMGKNYDMVLAGRACENIANETDYNAQTVGEPCESNSTIDDFSDAMSQDEVIGYLYGAAFIDQYVGNQAIYNGENIREINKNITGRIVTWVREGGNFSNFWRVTDPKNHEKVCRGPSAIWVSYPIAKIGSIVTGSNMQNLWSNSLGFVTWHSYKQLLFLRATQLSNAIANVDSSITISITADFGNGSQILHQQKIEPHGGHYTVSHFLQLATASRSGAIPLSYPFDFTGKKVIHRIAATYDKIVYDLAGANLKNYNPKTTEAFWRSDFGILNCGCNCIQGNTQNVSNYFGCQNFLNTSGVSANKGRWNLEDRWSSPSPSFNVSTTDPRVLNEFNGLDYMLAYNLYKLKKNEGYIDLMRRKFGGSYPYFILNPNGSFMEIGGSQDQLVKKAVFSIEASNALFNNTSRSKLFAGSDIKFTPGTHIKQGAVLVAQIKEFDCEPTALSNGSGYNYKTLDSNSNIVFADSIANNSDWDFIDDSTNSINDEPEIDTNAFSIVYSTNYDSVSITLNQGYVFDSNGNVIYTPQNKSLNPNIYETIFKSWNLYPNPSNDICNIDFTLYYDAEVSVNVHNELGQLVRNNLSEAFMKLKKGIQHLTINTNGFSPGIYFCELSVDGHQEVRKFTVLH